jgi:outer membrane protein
MSAAFQRMVCVLAAFAATCRAQQLPIKVEPRGSGLARAYEAPDISTTRQGNPERLGRLMRAGKIYLTLQDAIALALENNPDLELARYGPLLADWSLKRAQAGGPIRGVPSGSAQVSAVDNGLGANGSTAAAGLGNGGGNGGGGGGNGGATVQQIGQVTPNLDPNLQNATAFSHQTQPQPNSIVSGTTSLVQGKHTYNTVFQQGLLTGGILQITEYEQSLKENSPGDLRNPEVGPYMSVYLRHSLLQGFGIRLNDRFIRIGRLNVNGALETFRSQTLDVVATVVNLYWDLASADDELKARQQALQLARKFYEDTTAQIQIGAQARVELPRAQSEVAGRQLDLLTAETNVREQEIRLKNALIRNEKPGSEDPLLESAAIVPLDHMEVPPADDIPPLRQLVATAMAKRPDVAVSKIRDKTLEISALGTENPLLPSLNVTAQALDRGFAGTYQPSSGGPPDRYFNGGFGNAAGQILRRDFPSESVQLTFSASLGNRGSQADYGIDQLQLRQSAVSGQRDANAIVVAISNQLIALRQARAKYSATVNTRELQERLLTAEQQRFSFGNSNASKVIIAQRALGAAQTSEIDALNAYAHARGSLDQVMGLTLETNHVSLDEAVSGHVARESSPPEN